MVTKGSSVGSSLRQDAIAGEVDRVRLAAIVQSSHDAIIAKTITGTITAWNASAERMYGYSAEEAVGQPISILLPPDRPQEVAALLERLKRGEPIENFETVRQTRGGRKIDVSLTLSPLRGRQGQIIGASVIARDTTKRRRDEIKLRLLQSVTEAISSSHDFESAMGNALVLICETIGWDYGEAWVPNGDGSLLEQSDKVFLTSQRLEPFVRASSKLALRINEGLPGTVWSSRRPAWYLDVSSKPPQEFLRADAAAEVGLKGGFAVPIIADGDVLAVLTFFMMSEPRKEDLGLVIDLVQSVASQLGAVVQRKRIDNELQNANAELENKNREMEEFVYTVSHDLKTPLVTMGGLLGMLKEELQEERIVDAGELIAIAEETVAGMSDTIDELLKLSRLGRVACELEWLDFKTLAHDVIAKHVAPLEAKTVTVNVAAEDTKVLADRNRLVEVLDNLITNALKYACNGTDSRLVIGCETVGDEIHAFVRDNGPGIAEEDQEKVFELFQRLESDKDGSGVGLAIVRRIMEVHGGRAWVESKVNEGATFWLAFPIPVSEEVATG